MRNILSKYGINEAQCAAGPGIWVQNSGGFTLDNVNVISNWAQAHVANCSTAGGGLLAIASHVTLKLRCV